MHRPITIVLPYYENQGMLLRQYEHLRSLPGEMTRMLRLIVVDDGSPNRPAFPSGLPCRLAIYRIEVDIRWNQDAARNIGAKEAGYGWMIMTDMDHLVSEEALGVAMRKPLSASAFYRFGRVNAPALEPYHFHPNSFLIHTELFEAAGGYDERFAGWYGTDGDFVKRLMRFGYTEQFDEPLIRYPREVIADASTTTYLRKTPEDAENIKRIKNERSKIEDWKPLRFRNPYRRIF